MDEKARMASATLDELLRHNPNGRAEFGELHCVALANKTFLGTFTTKKELRSTLTSPVFSDGHIGALWQAVYAPEGLESLVKRVEGLELHIRPHKGVRELNRQVIAGFSPKGGVAVIANQLVVVAKTLIAVRNELLPHKRDLDFAQPSVFMVNGLLASAATGLQSVMDAIASFCQRMAPDEDHHAYIYFSTFEFRVIEWEFIRLIKEQGITPLQFEGRTFNEFANALKHEAPWVGLVSEVRGLQDVYDTPVPERDYEVKGAFRDMLVPAYNHVKKIVERLGAKFQQPVTLPFV